MKSMKVWRRFMLTGFLILAMATVYAADRQSESWIYGKWQLQYDPDGAQTDWLEFFPNGDATSIGPNGRIDGIYIVDGDRVKAVFSWKGKDFIMHFRADRENGLLRIVTSRSGKPSIYRKIDKP